MESNKKLVRELKKGKSETFKKLYFLYYDKLYHICRKFNLQLLSPEDFIQETFVRIYKNRHQLKEDAPLEAQIVSICKNIVYNHLNREKKVIPLTPNIIKREVFEEELEDEFHIKKQHLYKLIEELPAQQKKIFKLHKIDNYSYQEIASLTQLSHKTIANHLYLANNFIKKNIKNT